MADAPDGAVLRSCGHRPDCGGVKLATLTRHSKRQIQLDVADS
jgi:hypothetical protein